MRLVTLGISGLILLGATAAHWFFVGAWCGYYNGGPQDEQAWACDGPMLVAWPLLFGAFAAFGLVWAHRAPSLAECLARLFIIGVVGVLLWRLVPFELADSPHAF